MQKTAILLGATGLTGSLVLEQLLSNANYGTIKLFSRKSTGIFHPKVKEYIGDLLFLEDFKEDLTGDELLHLYRNHQKENTQSSAVSKNRFGYSGKKLLKFVKTMEFLRWLWFLLLGPMQKVL